MMADTRAWQQDVLCTHTQALETAKQREQADTLRLVQQLAMMQAELQAKQAKMAAAK